MSQVCCTFMKKKSFMNFVQNNFYGTQHPSGKFSRNILHFCQVIKKLSLIIYTLLDGATDYTYTSITNEFNTFYYIGYAYFIYKFFKQYFMKKITQHIVHINNFYTNYTVHKGNWNFQLSEDIFNFKI